MSIPAKQADGTYLVNGFKFNTAEEALSFLANNAGPAVVPPQAPAQPAAKKSGSVWKWVLGVPVAGIVLFLGLGVVMTNTPEGKERSQARSAIDLCWKEQERKSLTPGEQRFVAGSCEMMERQFRERFNATP